MFNFIIEEKKGEKKMSILCTITKKKKKFELIIILT